MSDLLKKNLRFAHLLIFSEQPERSANSHSFVLRDLSKLFTVAHLIWAIWANERMSNERIHNPDGRQQGNHMASVGWWKGQFHEIFWVFFLHETNLQYLGPLLTLISRACQPTLNTGIVGFCNLSSIGFLNPTPICPASVLVLFFSGNDTERRTRPSWIFRSNL